MRATWVKAHYFSLFLPLFGLFVCGQMLYSAFIFSVKHWIRPFRQSFLFLRPFDIQPFVIESLIFEHIFSGLWLSAIKSNPHIFMYQHAKCHCMLWNVPWFVAFLYIIDDNSCLMYCTLYLHQTFSRLCYLICQLYGNYRLHTKLTTSQCKRKSYNISNYIERFNMHYKIK